MRLLVAALLVMLNCSWAYAAKGSIMASPNPCTIQSGQSTCTETITWSSDTALAQVYVVDPATGTRQLFGSGRAGSQAATWVSSQRNMELRVNSTVLSSITIYGVAATPSLSVTLAANPNTNLVAPAPVTFSATTGGTSTFASIRFLVGQAVVCTVAYPGPYSCSPYTLSAGSYTATAVALDAGGAILATSNSVPLTVGAGTSGAPTLTNGASAGSDGYTISLTGTNFASDAYVDVRTTSNDTIIASYSGTQLTRSGTTGLAFYVSDATQRSNLNSSGLRFWVVNASTSQFAGPVTVIRTAPVAPAMFRGGSNFIWYYVDVPSTDCSREDYSIVNDYHRTLPAGAPFYGSGTVRSYVQSQLAQMYQAGQRSVAMSLFLAPTTPAGYGEIDAYGVNSATQQSFLPSLSPKYVSNLRDFVNDAQAAGFTHMTVRFNWSGDNPPWLWSGVYQTDLANGWRSAISAVHAGLQGVSIPIEYDLGGELMPTGRVPSSSPDYQRQENWNQWATETWAWYVSQFGSQDSLGYSLPSGVLANLPIENAKADLEARLRNTVNVYGSAYPSNIAIHFYEQPGALFDWADQIMDSIGKSSVPFKVGETFFNSSIDASELAARAVADGRPISRLLQWPLAGQQRGNTSTPNCDHVTTVPIDYSQYLQSGF